MGEGESGMIWENGIETYNIIYGTNCQSRFDAGYRKLGAGALRDGMGRELGGGFRMGNMCIPVANAC